jgi:hypothetical protein
MTPAMQDFKRWFIDSLSPLRANGHAGFVFVLIAFPLLERYLRGKSACPEGQPLTPAFLSNLGVLFPAIAGKEKSFWDCYRNGLLHQVTFPKAKLDRKTRIWVALPEAGISGYDQRPVYFIPSSNRFFLNPLVFFDLVTSTILADFSAYEAAGNANYRLPQALELSTGTETIVPTINTSLPNCGPHKP